MKKVVLTGATSFLGRNLLINLAEENVMIYAYVRESSKNFCLLPIRDNIIYIYGDLDEIESIAEQVSEADYMVHFAWDGSGNAGRGDEAVQAKNVEYACRALKVAKQLQCHKFIFPGSQAEYGNHKGPICEDTDCIPISAYGRAKLEFCHKAQKYCEEHAIDLVYMRIFSVYGYGDRKGTLVDTCVNHFLTGEKIHLGPCMQCWNFLDIDDFTTIVKMLMYTEGNIGIINVASDDTRVLREFIDEIKDVTKSMACVEYDSIASNPEGSPNLIPNIAKLMGILGNYKFQSFREGIAKIIVKGEQK